MMFRQFNLTHRNKALFIIWKKDPYAGRAINGDTSWEYGIDSNKSNFKLELIL